jgi:hypothetical protein
MSFVETKLPPPTSPVWKRVVEGQFSDKISSFALKILLRRLKSRLERKNDPETLQACIEELRKFLLEQKDLSTVQHDINVLLGN